MPDSTEEYPLKETAALLALGQSLLALHHSIVSPGTLPGHNYYRYRPNPALKTFTPLRTQLLKGGTRTGTMGGELYRRSHAR
jgi:hypothetical protein